MFYVFSLINSVTAKKKLMIFLLVLTGVAPPNAV